MSLLGLRTRVRKLERAGPCFCATLPVVFLWSHETPDDPDRKCPRCGRPLVSQMRFSDGRDPATSPASTPRPYRRMRSLDPLSIHGPFGL